MQIITVSSLEKNEAIAVSEIKRKLLEKSAEQPDFLQIYFCHDFDCETLRQAFIKEFPNTKFAAANTAIGAFDKNNLLGFSNNQTQASVPTSRFVVRREFVPKIVDAAVFVMAFYDKRSSFGCSLSVVEDLNDLQTGKAVQDAAASAGRKGVIPDLIIFHYSREIVFTFRKQFTEVFGTNTAIIGGAVGSHIIPHKFFTHDGVVENKKAYLFSFMYLQCEVSIELHSSCYPTDVKAKVTSVNDKNILEINHQPAADWLCRRESFETSKSSQQELSAVVDRLKLSVMIGKEQNTVTHDKKYNITVLNGITKERGLQTNYQWEEGDEICVMHADNTKLSETFMVKKIEDYRSIIAQIHIMCVSYCSDSNANNYISNVVNIVRAQHLVDNYLVFSAGGEVGKDVEDSMVLGNFTVATVSFVDTKKETV